MVKTKVVSIGKDAYFEGYPLLVIFGKNCPDELKDICIVHEYMDKPNAEMIKVGGKILIGGNEYTVEKIGGDAANENLYNLGHMTINFSPDLDLMPGSILVSPCVVPDIKQGDIIEF